MFNNRKEFKKLALGVITASSLLTFTACANQNVAMYGPAEPIDYNNQEIIEDEKPLVEETTEYDLDEIEEVPNDFNVDENIQIMMYGPAPNYKRQEKVFHNFKGKEEKFNPPNNLNVEMYGVFPNNNIT